MNDTSVYFVIKEDQFLYQPLKGFLQFSIVIKFPHFFFYFFRTKENLFPPISHCSSVKSFFYKNKFIENRPISRQFIRTKYQLFMRQGKLTLLVNNNTESYQSNKVMCVRRRMLFCYSSSY